jgi:hypothetical protein
MGTVSIRGLDKAVVLAALYNNAKPRGATFVKELSHEIEMTLEQAQEALELGDDLVRNGWNSPSLYFDYLNGRPLKVHLGEDSFDSSKYDRLWGQGAALDVILKLWESRVEKQPNIWYKDK